MTLVFIGLGALAAGLGTSAAAVAFVAAAVVGAMGGVFPAVATWTAALAAALAALGRPPRRLALPALGVAAALGAASARNTAAVLALWVLATATAVLARGPGAAATRWAITLCVADLPLAGAVFWTALRIGFEGWPHRLDEIGLALLLVAVALRAPLASGPEERPEAGLLAVRAQTAVLIALAVTTRGADRETLIATSVLGAVGFAVGGLFRRPATSDAVQELSLVAVAAAGARLGWVPDGWEWAALAAGTLMHSLRFSAGATAPGRVAGVLLRGAGVGLPFFPVVVAVLEGAAGASGWEGVVVAVTLIGGLWARAATGLRVSEPAEANPRGGNDIRVIALLVLVIVAALWAPVFSFQEAPVVDAIDWPPVWMVGAIVLCAAIGLWLPRAEQRYAGQAMPGAGVPELRAPGRWAGERSVVLALAATGGGAAALWVIGVIRGFL